MSGDDPDFLEFFAGEFWSLRRVGFLLTGDWDQAEELAQEAMARTWAVWPRVRGYDLPAAYARKVLVNRHRSLLRRAVVEARHLVASRPEVRDQPQVAGDDLVLWQALQRLPARQRAAIVLRYYLDLPEAEVARLLGAPVGTVKSWTHRGLPGGQAYVVVETVADPGPPPSSGTATTRRPADLARYREYGIDWGRGCVAGARPPCGTRVVRAGVMAANAALWDRYRAVGDAIVGTIAPVTALAPSTGGSGRPACHPDQWRLFHPGGWSYGDLAQRYVLEGGFKFVGGTPCHLRVTLRLEVEKPAGRPLPLAGNPSTTTVEGELPEDQDPSTDNATFDRPSPLTWIWAWQEWCNKGLPQATLRITAETGATITVPGPPKANPPEEPETGCKDRGRRSTIAPWP